MVPTPTYVVIQGEVGEGRRKVVYAGHKQRTAEEVAKRECGYGETKPNTEIFRHAYKTKLEVWSEGEKIAEHGYTRNGHRHENSRIMRDEETDVSDTVGEI